MKWLVLSLLPFLVMCSNEEPERSRASAVESPVTYFSTMRNLVVEVAYEPGAEPYTGQFAAGTHAGSSYWEILRRNLAAIFEGRPASVMVTVPKALSEMARLSPQGRATWSGDEIWSLARATRRNFGSETAGHFYVMFLNGYYYANGAAQPSVLGVNLSGTSVIALFKDVIQSTGSSPDALVPKYVEQATLVHEMGHALGLVNLGVPLTSDHHDSANGAHCTNTSCAMYYSNEARNNTVNFVAQYIASGELVMLGAECLSDTRSYRP